MIPKLFVYITCGSLAIAAAMAVLLAVENLTSRNIALGAGAIAGSVVLFIVQLVFDMRSSETHDIFGFEYTLDRQTPSIGQLSYAGISPRRQHAESTASHVLSVKQPKAFVGGQEKLGIDLAIYSLLSYIGNEQFDWQLHPLTISTPTFGTVGTFVRSSPAKDCKAYSVDELREKLQAAGNAFEPKWFSIMGTNLCLPPDTVLTVTADSIAMTNPFCRIVFRAKGGGALSFRLPNSDDEPKLKDGTRRFETRNYSVRTDVFYFWWRSQHRMAPQYHEWAERIVSGAKLWFEGLGENATSSRVWMSWPSDWDELALRSDTTR